MALDHDSPHSLLFADFGVQLVDSDRNRKSFLEARFADGLGSAAVVDG